MKENVGTEGHSTFTVCSRRKIKVAEGKWDERKVPKMEGSQGDAKGGMLENKTETEHNSFCIFLLSLTVEVTR